MAPEQCKGGMEIDARADLYAVGCILFELLAGRPPFVADGGGEQMAMHIYQAPPRLAQHVADVPPELDALVAKLLTKAPDDRAPSAAWTLATLERVGLRSLDGIEVPIAVQAAPAAVAEPDGPEEPEEQSGGFPWIPVIVIVLALAIAGAAVYFIGLRGDEKLTP
jgi:serine/threonine protein kinase